MLHLLADPLRDIDAEQAVTSPRDSSVKHILLRHVLTPRVIAAEKLISISVVYLCGVGMNSMS